MYMENRVNQMAVMQIMDEKITYPERPIKLIVPFGAGGGVDFQARTLEKFVSQHLGQPVVVINSSGGAGTIGWNEVWHAKKDGYTLGMATNAALLHTLYRPKETHYFTVLDPLAQISANSMVIVINSKKPWRDIHDLIGYARENPKKVKYGNSGIGTAVHILSEELSRMAKIEIGYVPFRSGSESLAALLGNHIEFTVISPSVAKEHVKAGTLKAIAVTGEKRMKDPLFADVPTLKECGIELAFTNWFSVVAPKELPPKVKAKLEAALKAAIAEPEFKKYMENLGLEIEYLGCEDSRRKWCREIETYKKMLDDTGLLEVIREKQK